LRAACGEGKEKQASPSLAISLTFHFHAICFSIRRGKTEKEKEDLEDFQAPWAYLSCTATGGSGNPGLLLSRERREGGEGAVIVWRAFLQHSARIARRRKGRSHCPFVSPSHSPMLRGGRKRNALDVGLPLSIMMPLGAVTIEGKKNYTAARDGLSPPLFEFPPEKKRKKLARERALSYISANGDHAAFGTPNKKKEREEGTGWKKCPG